MKPNFCVVTSTYKRPKQILRSLSSVQKQNYSSWKMVIVIDDTESNYSELELLSQSDQRIIVIKNNLNLGKNASVNKAFDFLRQDGFAGFLVFLDDDDWLSSTCLEDFSKSISTNGGLNWLVSKRTQSQTQEAFTVNKTGRDLINYQYDVLLKRRFYGDATHCINFKVTDGINFPTLIKNAEEWLYFSQLSFRQNKFKFIDSTGTFSEGYATEGLTTNYHKYQERWKNNYAVLREVWQRRIFSLPVFIYICGRLIKSLR